MECKNCGSATDPIVSECQYCGSPIKGVDLNSIPTEDVIRYANKWIGLMEEISWSGMAVKPNHSPKNILDAGGIDRAGINSYVKEYLSLLDMRADKDALANRKFSQLKQYKAAFDSFEKRRKRVIRNMIIGFSIPIIFLIIMIILENMGIV